MNDADEELGKELAALTRYGGAVCYSITQINKYEIHCWESDRGKMYKLFGHFPHFNPKVGNHQTVEAITEEELQAIKDNTFDKAAFDVRLIEGYKKAYPHLWK